ncbi:MAG: hypothetical protein ACRC62_18400 [Microcoleus sp.]
MTIGQNLLKSENRIKQAAAKSLGSVVTGLNKTLANWGKSTGLVKAIGQIGTLAGHSKTFAALGQLPKALETLGRFASLGMKVLPVVSSLITAYKIESIINNGREVNRKLDILTRESFSRDQAITRRLIALERGVNKPAIDYQKIASSTSSALQQAGLAKSNDVSSIKADIQRLGAQNYGPQFQSLNSNVSSIKADIQRLGAQNYGPQFQSLNSNVSSIKADIQRLGAPNYGPQLQTLTSGIQSLATGISALQAKGVDYAQINSIVTRAVDGKQFNFDYSRVGSEAAQAFRLPSDLARKSDIPSDLARKSDIQAIPAPKIDLSQVLNKIPSDIARKTDVDAIPSKIPIPTVNLNPVLTQLSVIGTRLTNLDSRVGQVNLSPLQSQLNSLQSAISGNINAGTNIVTNAVTNMGNTLQNFVTNNNTTIVNQISRGIDLNPASIIDPLKQHINTQVAQPLSKTMEVLNVNDLARGVSMSAEAVIKAAGMQQYGQGTSTATNLIGLTAMIASPIFMRAGFHQLGNQFPADMRNPQGAKVTPTTALSMSQWQFNQMTNLVGMPTKMMVKEASGSISQRSFQNQSDAIENIHAQNLGMEQDLSAIEKYLFKIMQQVEIVTNIVFQNKHDIDVIIDELGPKTKQKIVSKPSPVTHGKNDAGASFFDRLMGMANNFTVVREWNDEIDAKQLAQKTNMEAQIAALTNKWEFDKTSPKLPIVDRPDTQKPKKQNDEEWRRYVHTSENPDTARQTPGLAVPEIKEFKLGTVKEVPKPETNPEKLLGS